MTIKARFGRRLAIPSTRQIKHELLLVVAHDEARIKALQEKAAEPIPAVAAAP